MTRDDDGPRGGEAGLDRRALLARVGAVAAAAGLRISPLALLEAARARTASAAPPGAAPRTFTPYEWRVAEAAQETLWPAGGDAPGAREVGATAYLDAALADPDVAPRDAAVVREGLRTLDALAARCGARSFVALPPAGREAVIAAWRDADGADWIRTTLRYTLEAVLGDPVHGGNPAEAGWRWIGFEPGSPRPAPRRGGGAR